MNHNLQLLQSLYVNTSGKYRKLKVRFDKAVHNGRFYKLNKRKQSFLVSRLKKLYERLKSLHTQLRLAGATAALTATLLASSPTQAQSTLGPFERNDALNPFPPPINFFNPRPAAVDIDDDGDLDVFIGNHYGNIQFFRNDSPENSVTQFIELTDSDNPFDGVDRGSDAAPAFADVDGDGDFDMLLGTYSGDTYFFRNTGSKTNPVFTEQTGANNPFDGITGTDGKYGTRQAFPIFVNLDGDSDIDLFIGSSYISDISGQHSAIQYFENNAGVFTFINDTGTDGALEFENQVTIAHVDVDGDDALDMIVGTSGTTRLRCFLQGVEGIFTESPGNWNPTLKTGNPFENIFLGNYKSPIAADFDGDDDIDFLVGVGGGSTDRTNLRYFENTDGEFILRERAGLNVSPFGGVDVGDEAAPTFVDLDGDGDLDAILGSKYADDIQILVNTNGKFILSPDHPLVEVIDNLGYSTIPVFVDIDHDGDLDLFVTTDYDVYFLRNTEGSFDFESSPIDISGLDINDAALSFVDIDNDEDLDAFIGEDDSQSQVYFFRNDGDAEEPDFVPATAPEPFNSLTLFEDNPKLFAVDIDHDGDLDISVTETYYNGWYGDANAAHVRLFENLGDGTFEEMDSELIIELTPYSFVSFADVDGDGDMDAFVGNGYSFDYNQNGRVFYYENTNPAPATNAQQSTLVVSGGSPSVIAPSLTIEDEDDDDIVSATVTISDFVSGAEELGFTGEDGIIGTFDNDEGILTFVGKASIETYESLLRSVTINFTGEVPGGKKSRAARELSLDQTITFQVRDTDFTLTTILAVQIVTIEVVPGDAITVFNAISPGKDDNKNAFLRIASIETISPENKVTIYNRWGDIVFDVKNYNNAESSKRFEGISNNGKDLPTGTYFYKIELSGKVVTGYLSLKR